MASRSSSSRVRWMCCSTPGTATGATAARESISLAPRTSSQKLRRSRNCMAPLAVQEPLPRGRVGGGDDPPEVVDQRRVEVEAAELGHATRTDDGERGSPSLRTTATSSVPPPKSKTASALPTGTGRRRTSLK